MHEERTVINHLLYNLQVYVIAKDWGAFVAYYLGYAHPERVIGIIAVGIPFIPPSSLAFNVNQLPEGHYVRRWAVKTVTFSLYILVITNSFHHSIYKTRESNQFYIDLE